MAEKYYQTKMMKGIRSLGGYVINGTYSTSGEADLQCGFPVWVQDDFAPIGIRKKILVYLALEAKDKENYHRVMSAITKNYKIKDRSKLKPHEPLQINKIRKVRKLGGLALVAYNIEQVQNYIKEHYD